MKNTRKEWESWWEIDLYLERKIYWIWTVPKMAVIMITKNKEIMTIMITWEEEQDHLKLQVLHLVKPNSSISICFDIMESMDKMTCQDTILTLISTLTETTVTIPIHLIMTLKMVMSHPDIHLHQILLMTMQLNIKEFLH